MKRSYRIFSEKGDEYKLSLSDDDGLNLFEELAGRYHVQLISIELTRINGNGSTPAYILNRIEDLIAATLVEYPNAVMCYYCDFLNPVPSSNKPMPPQEYRSRLFSLMFQRYVHHHEIEGVSEVIVRVDGIEEVYYFHMITRNRHLGTVKQIATDIQGQFQK